MRPSALSALYAAARRLPRPAPPPEAVLWSAIVLMALVNLIIIVRMSPAQAAGAIQGKAFLDSFLPAGLTMLGLLVVRRGHLVVAFCALWLAIPIRYATAWLVETPLTSVFLPVAVVSAIPILVWLSVYRWHAPARRLDVLFFLGAYTVICTLYALAHPALLLPGYKAGVEARAAHFETFVAMPPDRLEQELAALGAVVVSGPGARADVPAQARESVGRIVSDAPSAAYGWTVGGLSGIGRDAFVYDGRAAAPRVWKLPPEFAGYGFLVIFKGVFLVGACFAYAGLLAPLLLVRLHGARATRIAPMRRDRHPDQRGSAAREG